MRFGNQSNFNQNALYGKGSIDFIRITKGVGRYSSNHTPFRIKKLLTTPHTFTLTTTNEYRDISFNSYIEGSFNVKFKNNKNITINDSIGLTFYKTPSITLIPPSTIVTNETENSNEYRINLVNASLLPVKITIALEAGMEFATPPTNLTGINEITLDSTNSFSVFTLTAATAGNYSLSLTNDKSLTNPNTVQHIFVVESADPLFLNENDLRLNLNKPDDTRTDLNMFQSII
jgi:hypothetical protein